MVLDGPDAKKGWFVDAIRFFAPTYCAGKNLTPYEGNLVDDLTFPLERREVLAKLGSPSRSSVKINRFDDYDFPDCTIRFQLRNTGDEIVFVCVQLPTGPRKKAEGVPRLQEQHPSLLPRSTEQLGVALGSLRVRLRKGSESISGPSNEGAPSIDVVEFREKPGFLRLVTSGMSDERMRVPKGYRDAVRLELETYVKVVQVEIIDRLVRAAQFPFVERTYLGHGDTIDWGRLSPRDPD